MRAAFVLAMLALVACAGVLGLKKDVAPLFPHRAHVVAGVEL